MHLENFFCIACFSTYLYFNQNFNVWTAVVFQCYRVVKRHRLHSSEWQCFLPTLYFSLPDFSLQCLIKLLL